MGIEDAPDLIFQEALRRLGTGRKLDTEVLQRKMAEVVQEHGETIFAQLSHEASVTNPFSAFGSVVPGAGYAGTRGAASFS